MKIGIIAAMEQEIALLRNRMSNFSVWRKAGCNIYIGKLFGIEVALIKSGVGKVSAALGTTLLLNFFQPNLIINTGSAGSLKSSPKIGDIVVPYKVGYHDVNLTVFGYKEGQMAKCPKEFKSDPFLTTLANKIAVNCLKVNSIHHGMIVTGDTFINNSVDLACIQRRFPSAIAVEMEAAAVAHICYRFNVSFIITRAITDFSNQTSHLFFKKFLIVASKNSSLLVEEIIKSLKMNHVA
ncbi:5'-methylthioadenosine/S-adenosylhomocysteine nucleosidase [Sodalis sp. CWE]|uniref:5'-methylthioadenosine/S-adenosylhomocysteine nucleosidase n=1 Tax=Sodalis sp. CWE TaxID=2803816 RepID=UPI001C7D4D21|nr:5'-methylthioadenosine/S-adenosylhomocysteine nucleosidase [Sodalis sp. CWE]MBX4180991.1 5'-methylthioadenosine/S-adenosylhomocysteine nucleosidase [Sodalis sp. CWE]